MFCISEEDIDLIKMESCMQFIPRKSYNTYGYVVLALFFLTAVTLIGITSHLNAKSNLSCNPGKNVVDDIKEKTFVETECFLKYERKYNSPVPFNWFVILNFGLVLSLCIIYAYSVKSRIERWDKPTTTTNDVELHATTVTAKSNITTRRRWHEVSFNCILHLSFTFVVLPFAAHDIVCCIIQQTISWAANRRTFGSLSCWLSNEVLLSLPIWHIFKCKYNRQHQTI